MSLIIKFIVMSLFILNSSLAFGGISNEVVVKGKVVKFNKETVTLSQKERHVIVPRKSIPKHIKLMVGAEAFATLNTTRDVASSNQPPHSTTEPEQKKQNKKQEK